MSAWYCPRCRMNFAVGKPRENSERCGCPDCGLFFHAGATDQRPPRTTVTVHPDDLAKHKASFETRPAIHELVEAAE